MKSLKKLSLGLLAATLLTGSAFAAGTPANPTIVHVVGSTAFRPGATAAIIDILNGSGTAKVHLGYVGTSGSTVPLSAGEAIIANGTLTVPGGATGTATIIVETYWTGSLAGVVDVAIGNTTGTYLDPAGLTAAQIGTINSSTVISSNNYYGGTVSTSGVANYEGATEALFSSSAVNLQAEIADMAMSDTDDDTIATELTTASLNTSGGYTSIPAQNASFSGTPTFYSNPTALGNAITTLVEDAGNPSLTNAANAAGYVGIVPFLWAACENLPTGFVANMTQQTANALMSKGFVPQSAFTGTTGSADVKNYFYLVGRNEDSGTRIGAVTEAQYDVTANPNQYAIPNVAIPNPTLTSPTQTTTPSSYQKFPKVPLNTEPSIIWNQTAHSGYASGSNVASAIKTAGGSFTFASGAKAPGNSGNSYLVGYIGVADAQTALVAGATALSYNGVAYSVPAVQSGEYTFWYYEHCYRLVSKESTDVGNFIDQVADEIYSTDADVSVQAGGHDSSITASGILPSTMLVTRSAAGGPITAN